MLTTKCNRAWEREVQGNNFFILVMSTKGRVNVILNLFSRVNYKFLCAEILAIRCCNLQKGRVYLKLCCQKYNILQLPCVTLFA